jgi:hypothetical protein
MTNCIDDKRDYVEHDPGDLRLEASRLPHGYVKSALQAYANKLEAERVVIAVEEDDFNG